MFRKTMFATAALMLGITGSAFADPIEGNWKTQSGETAQIASCGSGYCITLRTGKHKGKQIGSMKASGAGYTGSITDPADDKTYKGKASISGNSMKMSGCVLGGLICRGQNWSRM